MSGRRRNRAVWLPVLTNDEQTRVHKVLLKLQILIRREQRLEAGGLARLRSSPFFRPALTFLTLPCAIRRFRFPCRCTVRLSCVFQFLFVVPFASFVILDFSRCTDRLSRYFELLAI